MGIKQAESGKIRVLLRNSGCQGKRKGLTCTSHRASAAAADPGMFTALRFLGLLDRARLAKLRIHARLHRLATNHGEKCSLAILII